MVVAVPPVGMMEVAIHQVVDVVTVGNCLVPAIDSMNVMPIVAVANMSHGAIVRILLIHRNRVFDVVIAVATVKVTVVQIIGVIPVLDRRVAATRSVNVDVGRVGEYML